MTECGFRDFPLSNDYVEEYHRSKEKSQNFYISRFSLHYLKLILIHLPYQIIGDEKYEDVIDSLKVWNDNYMRSKQKRNLKMTFLIS